MKVYHFPKHKYPHDILMDFGRIEENTLLDLSSEIHSTTFFEILFITDECGYLYLDSRKINIGKKHILFISPNQKRRWFVDKSKLKGFYITFEKDFLNEFFIDNYFVYRLQYFYNLQVLPYFVPSRQLFSFEHDIFGEIKKEINHYQKDSKHLLRSILYYVLIKLNREFSDYHNLESDTEANTVAFKFKELLKNNIQTLQRVNDYCNKLNISRISLNKATQKQYGISASQMIKEQLLYEIKDQILFSSQTLSEISYAFGFPEPNHFSRFFKRMTGFTPVNFRNGYQNEHKFN